MAERLRESVAPQSQGLFFWGFLSVLGWRSVCLGVCACVACCASAGAGGSSGASAVLVLVLLLLLALVLALAPWWPCAGRFPVRLVVLAFLDLGMRRTVVLQTECSTDLYGESVSRCRWARTPPAVKRGITDVLRHHEEGPCTSDTKDQRKGFSNRGRILARFPQGRRTERSVVWSIVATTGSYSPPRPRSITQLSVSLCPRGR